MLPVVVTVLVGGLLVFVGYTAWRSRMGKPAPGAETLAATICDVREGGAIRLAGFGDDGEDVLLPVTAFVRVRLGTEEWFELAGEYRSRHIRLEWRRRPGGTRVVAYSKTDMPLSEVGVDPAALEGARVGSAPLVALGAPFKVEEAGEAVRAEAQAVRTWGLYDEEKRRVLRIERAGEQPARASLGRVVAADAIEVVKRS